MKQKNVINGIVVTNYEDDCFKTKVIRCVDYKFNGKVIGFVDEKRTAKQQKPLMKGLSQEF